jgi:hypothetical protein
MPLTPTDRWTVATANEALTLWSEFMVSPQVELVPLHAPPQPVNSKPELGVSVSVTSDLNRYSNTHVFGPTQLLRP